MWAFQLVNNIQVINKISFNFFSSESLKFSVYFILSGAKFLSKISYLYLDLIKFTVGKVDFHIQVVSSIKFSIN